MNVKVRCHLKQILKQKKIKQSELAVQAKIRASTISDLCNKEIDRIYISTVERICAVLNIQVGDLLKLEEQSDKSA
jgi:putative transcriptional regulator